MLLNELQLNNLIGLIRDDKIPEGKDLKSLIFSYNEDDVIFGLQLLGLRLFKRGDFSLSLKFLNLALEISNYNSKNIIQIIEEVCKSTQSYDELFSVILKFALKVIREKKFEEAIEAINFALYLDSYFGVAKKEEKDLLWQNTLNLYRMITEEYSIDFSYSKKDNQILHIAHILPRLLDNWSIVKVLKTFINHHDYEKFKVFVYTTEQDVRNLKAIFKYSCFKSPSKEVSISTQNFLKEKNIPYFFADPNEGFIPRVLSLVKKLRQDKIDIAIYYGYNICCLDCLLAYFWPAFVQINMNLGTPMFISELDCVTYFVKENYLLFEDFWKKMNVPSYLMPSGIDVEFKDNLFSIYEKFDLPKKAVILATCSMQIPSRMSSDFLDLVARLLKEFPLAYYLIIGEGDKKELESFFQKEDVLDRVRFCGYQEDVPTFLKSIDIYLNEFNEGGGLAVLEAMAAKKPVVAMFGSSFSVSGCAGANYVGEEFSVKSGDQEGYFNFAKKLIQDESFRKMVGLKMYERYKKEFSPQKMVKAFEDLALKIYNEKFSKIYN